MGAFARTLLIVVLCCHALDVSSAKSLDDQVLAWAANGCSATLEEAASIDTAGCAGFEAFSINGTTMLAAANFWDGRSRDMSAKSMVYRVAENISGGRRKVEVVEEESMSTKGAHGWDFFETSGESPHRLLVIPNYYACGSVRGPVAEDAACRSTVVYLWQDASAIRSNSPSIDSARRHSYRWQDREKASFRQLQELATSGPGQTDHFFRANNTYLVVGENFAHQVSVFVWEGETLSFKRFQTLKCPGAGATAVAEINKDIWLVATSYHSGSSAGWSTKSPVFVWEEGAAGFVEAGFIDGHGVHDAEMLAFNGRHFLFLAHDRNNTSPLVSSEVLVFDEKQRKFVTIQRLATDGAHAGELFVANGLLWLAVANFGDRHEERYAAESTLWRWDSAAVAEEGGREGRDG